VRGSAPLEVKYAACCVFRALALHEDFLPYLTQEVLPAVLAMRNASAKFKVSSYSFTTVLLFFYTHD